jgi:hypothetical protein
MDAELAAYDRSIDRRFGLVVECIRGLTAEQLNFRPSAGDANSLWALATHIGGNARAWICGIAAGTDMGRDRPGEFAASGRDAAALLAHVEAARATVLAALHGIAPARLDMRLVPAQELWGEGPPREISVRDAVLQVIEHASLHIGAMQVTRDLALARR